MSSTRLDSSQIGVSSGESLEQHLEQVDAALADASNRIIVFVIPGLLRQGVQKLEIRFPFNGTITKVYASCAVLSTDPTTISVEKNSQVIIDSGNPESGWQSIFSTNLTIDGNKKTNNTSQLPYVISNSIVEKNDHFRLNLISIGDGIKDLTVEVEIKI